MPDPAPAGSQGGQAPDGPRRWDRASDYRWNDGTEAGDGHGRIIRYDELRLEQTPPPEAVAGVEVGVRTKQHEIEANMVYVTAEQAVEAGLALLEEAWRGWAANRADDEGPVNRMSHDQRWRAHVAACSLTDSTFWVREDEQRPGYYVATEVETGTSAWGHTAQEAMQNYYAARFHEPPVEQVEEAGSEPSPERGTTYDAEAELARMEEDMLAIDAALVKAGFDGPPTTESIIERIGLLREAEPSPERVQAGARAEPFRIARAALARSEGDRPAGGER